MGGKSNLTVLPLRDVARRRPTEHLPSRETHEIGGEREGWAFYLERVPHAWMFERCSCVVHHGGAGSETAPGGTGSGN